MKSLLSLIFFVVKIGPFTMLNVVSIAVILGLLSPVGAWITKHLFDILQTTLSSSSDVSVNIWLYLSAFVAIQFAPNISAIAETMYNRLGRKGSLSAITKLYSSVINIKFQDLEEPSLQDNIRFAVHSTDQSLKQTPSIIFNVVRNTTVLIGFIVVTLIYTPLLSLLLIAGSVPILLIDLRLSRERIRYMKQFSSLERRSYFYSHLLSDVGSAKEVRVNALGSFIIDKFAKINEQINREEGERDQVVLRWEIISGVFSSLLMASFYTVMFLQAFRGLLTIGDITLAIATLGGTQGSLASLSGLIASASEAGSQYAVYRKLLSINPISDNELLSKRKTPKLISQIELKNLSFKYPNSDQYILKNVNLTIPVGKSLALVGLNGAGKTTLVKLLARLYTPTDGQILWDGIDIQEFALADYHSHTGIVFQDFLQYDFTAYENIAVGDINKIHDISRVRSSADRAGLNKTILAFPHGYQTLISRRFFDDDQTTGVELSGGQWQKFALARLFMKDCDILILDEPTAALDAQAEVESFEQFSRLLKGKSGLIISHRFSTVQTADIVAVLENGVITEVGTHTQLIAKGDTYSKLYKMQAQRYC